MFNIQFNCIIFTHHSHHPKWFGFQVKLTKRQYFQFNVVPTVIKLIMQLISHIHIDIVYGTKPKPWPFSSIYYRLHKWHEMKQIITTIMSKPYLIRWGAQNRLKKIKWEFNDMFFFFFFFTVQARERETFNPSQFLAQGDEVSPLHVTASYESKDLFSREHRHPFQVFSINTVFLKNLPIATKIYSL